MATIERYSLHESKSVRGPERPNLRSEEYVPKTMPRVLGLFDMTATFVCALFLITNAVLGATGGPVSLLYLALGGVVFFIPCVIATAQLGVMFPHEGALYSWTYKALGSFWSFFVTLCYWLTGVLAVITGSDAFVTVLQGLNNAWLPQPWQQGLVILAIIAVGAIICLQRYRTVQNIINSIFCLTILAVFLIGLAAVVWLATGHAPATNFRDPTGWSVNPGNFALFGIITLNYIGASGPLNLAGEVKGSGEETGRRIITRHLLWGMGLVFACYFITSLSVLIVRGPAIANAVVPPFEAFTAVGVTLGVVVRDISVICFLFYCVVSSIFYTSASSRLLMVGGIDQRIPVWFARLNKNRAPANAILFQNGFAMVVTVIIFIVAPYVAAFGGNSANTLLDIYNVNSAATTLVWTIATIFFFINIIFLYRRNARWFRQFKLFPTPVLWISVIVGTTACLMTIGGVLYYSWIPQLIGNGSWWYIVGGLTVFLLIIAAVGSMFANSEATWQSMRD